MNVVTVDGFEHRRNETGLNSPDIDDFWRVPARLSQLAHLALLVVLQTNPGDQINLSF